MTNGGSELGEPRPWLGSAVDSLNRRAQRRRIDGWTAEVVTALRAAGIRPILLKGPAIARWLYADGDARSYRDLDLMVGPRQLHRTETVLMTMGFQEPLATDRMIMHARIWVRPADGAAVDLHRTLHCAEYASAARVWAAVAGDTESIPVGGVDVEIPGAAVRVLHVALHASPAEKRSSQALADLARAIERVDPETWRAAAAVSRRLGVEGAMAQHLRQTPEGAALADQLRLPDTGPVSAYMAAGVTRPDVSASGFMLWSLASQKGPGARVRWILRHQFPSRPFMEHYYPMARRGAVGLVASYGVRAGHSLLRLPSAVANLARLERRLGRAGRRGPA